MTVSESSQTSVLDRIAATTLTVSRLFGPHALAGCVVYATWLVLAEMAVPLSERLTLFEPMLSLSALPHWVQPRLLEPTALVGLKPLTLAGALVLWLAATAAVTLATALVLHSLDREARAAVPPVARLLRLFAYALGSAVVVGGAAYALRDVTLATVVGVAALVFVLGQLFVAPVAIVRTDRSLFESVRWSSTAIRDGGMTIAVTVLVLGLAFAYRVAVAASVFLFGPETAIPVAAIAGTTVVGGSHAFCMHYVYSDLDERR